MTAFVHETKLRVLRRIGAPAEIVSAVEHAPVSRHTSSRRGASESLRSAGPVKSRCRNGAESGPRNSFIALFAVAAVIAVIAFVGARLIGVDAWGSNGGSPASVGEPATSLTPTSPASDLIGETAAIEIARMSNSASATSATAPAEARLMTYSSWTTGYDEGALTEVDPAQMVWVVSVNGPSTFPGYGSPGSTVPPSDGYTSIINANNGNLIAFRVQPTVFKPESTPATGIPADGSIFYKTTTFGALNKYGFIHEGIPDTDPVTIKTTIGTFFEGLAEGSTYSWETLVLDPTTGQPYASFSLPGDPPAELLGL